MVWAEDGGMVLVDQIQFSRRACLYGVITRFVQEYCLDGSKIPTGVNWHPENEERAKRAVILVLI